MRSRFDHSACASTKSMPCFALFAADFAASNSNRIWYRNYTTRGAARMARCRVWTSPRFEYSGRARCLLIGRVRFRIESATHALRTVPRVAFRSSTARWS